MSLKQLARLRYPSASFILLNTRTVMADNPNLTYRNAFVVSSTNWRNLSDADEQLFSDSLRDLRKRLNVPQHAVANHQ